MNYVNRMKLNANTLFAGEPTDSSPNIYGDNAPIVLPNSKLTLRLSKNTVTGYNPPRPTGLASA
jgi:hypothetical protein